MDCQQATALISARTDHEVESADRDALDVHLQECDGCLAAVGAFEHQDLALRRLFAACEAAGLGVIERVTAQLHAVPKPEAEDGAAQERRRLRRRSQRRAWMLAAAATIGGLFLISHLLLHPPEAPVQRGA